MSKSINFDKNYAMRSFLFIAFLCFCCTGLFAQDSLGWLAYPGEQVDTLTEGKIEVNADKRIDKLVAYLGTAHSPETKVKLEGYRVQLYFNNDKNICNQARSRFLSVTNNVDAYIQYQAPHYRLRVGNFRTLLQAEKFKQEISGHFPDAITVNDAIDLPSLD